jgi:hypothetical protein
MAEIGARRPCTLCSEGVMTWSAVPVKNGDFVDPYAPEPAFPEPVPEYLAWVCDTCGSEDRSEDSSPL